jgi:hypothetical protein
MRPPRLASAAARFATGKPRPPSAASANASPNTPPVDQRRRRRAGQGAHTARRRRHAPRPRRRASSSNSAAAGPAAGPSSQQQAIAEQTHANDIEQAEPDGPPVAAEERADAGWPAALTIPAANTTVCRASPILATVAPLGSPTTKHASSTTRRTHCSTTNISRPQSRPRSRTTPQPHPPIDTSHQARRPSAKTRQPVRLGVAPGNDFPPAVIRDRRSGACASGNSVSRFTAEVDLERAVSVVRSERHVDASGPA